MLIISLFPVIWVILSGFKELKEIIRVPAILPESFKFDEFVLTWKQLNFGRYYINSGIVMLGGVVCAVLFNGLLAYALGVLRPPGHKVVFALVMWSMLIPPTTSIVAQYVNIRRVVDFFALGLNVKAQDSLLSVAPLWLIMGANAFWMVLFKNFFEGIPKEYFEAAQLDGCSNLKIFSLIILPLSRPIAIVVAIFAATAAWSDFLLPNLLLNNGPWETVMVRLFEFRTAIRVNDADKLRAVVFSIIPPVILFSLFQKQLTKGISAGGIKG
jgi:multiple sugar transport system permease protein